MAQLSTACSAWAWATAPRGWAAAARCCLPGRARPCWQGPVAQGSRPDGPVPSGCGPRAAFGSLRHKLLCNAPKAGARARERRRHGSRGPLQPRPCAEFRRQGQVAWQPLALRQRSGLSCGATRWLVDSPSPRTPKHGREAPGFRLFCPLPNLYGLPSNRYYLNVCIS